MLSFLVAVALLVSPQNASAETTVRTGSAGSRIQVEALGAFNEPWAMTFLPDGRLLITEKPGTMLLVDPRAGTRQEVLNIPEVDYGGQGGLGEIILHPEFTENRRVYLSYAEKGLLGRRGAAVAMARLAEQDGTVKLEEVQIIWRQKPKTRGRGHYSHRLAFAPDGMLFITSGERQQQEPAQDWKQNLGKVIRLHDDGRVPEDNPFQDRGELAATYWSLGHRNMLGIAFDGQGRLWTHEMGPRHGDELNLTVRGGNYGWPVVSWGDQYSGEKIPNHDTRPEFNAPAAYWVPTIAPSGLVLYSGDLFPSWQGDALIGGLRSEALIHVKIDGDRAEEVERFAMGKRIREVEQGPDDALWLLEDRDGGRLLRLTPGSQQP